MKLMPILMLCAMASLGCSQPVSAKDLVIALDVSSSNPLLTDPTFKRSAALYIANAVAELKSGDRVVIKRVGSLNHSANFAAHTLPIERHNVKKVAKRVAAYILSLKQSSHAQGSTNLLAWLGRNPLSCGDGSRLIMLTDGLEASEYVNPNHLLSGKQALPAPSEFVKLSGCSVSFYGMGVGLLDAQTNRLRRAWQRYFEQAAARFEAIVL